MRARATRDGDARDAATRARRRSTRARADAIENDAREARAGEDREGEESTLTPRTRARDGFARTRKATDDDARFASDGAGGA